MGHSTYSTTSRAFAAETKGYHTKTRDDIFYQNKLKEIHSAMNPKGFKIREARDSEAHPNSIPVIVALDVTGSMGDIPHDLIKDGLPQMMGGIIQRGVLDVAMLFLGIGDHECDRAPLQVGQFESGDSELDMWLERTWLEGRGGGNYGESYSLAHLVAAKMTKTDHWDKRKKKGILITIGDEPNLQDYPGTAIKEITGEKSQGFSSKEMLKMAEEKWDVYHIFPGKISREGTEKSWHDLLGAQKCIMANTFQDVPNEIIKIVCNHQAISFENEKPAEDNLTTEDNSPEFL